MATLTSVDLNWLASLGTDLYVVLGPVSQILQTV